MDNKANCLLPLMTALLVSVITCLLMPLSMYDSNPAEFQTMAYYEVLLYSVVLTIALGSFVFMFLLVVKRFFPRLLLPTIGLIVGVSVALYAQGNLIGADYGAFDGHAIQWEAMRSVAVTNTLIWLVIIIVPVVSSLAWPKQLTHCIRFAVPVFIAYVLLLSIMLMVANASAFSRKRLMEFSLDKFMELSSERNLVVIVLDSFDRAIFDRLLAEDPVWRNRFAGFTYYHNTVGAYCWTNYALPQIVSGFPEAEGRLTVEEHQHKAYHEAPFLKMAKRLGFVVDAYFDEGHAPYADDGDDHLAVFGNSVAPINMLVSHKNIREYGSLYLYSLFRYVPHVAKKSWYGFKDCFKERFLLRCEKIEQELLARLNSDLFSLVDSKKIKIYHCFAVHVPELNLDKAKTGLDMVCRFVAKTRESGVYEKTDFFILADHGSFNRCHPLFMCSNGTSEFRVSEMPFSYRHLYEAFADSLNGRPISPVEASPAEMVPVIDDPGRRNMIPPDDKFFDDIGTEFSGKGLELLATTAEMDVVVTNTCAKMTWNGDEAIIGIPVEKELRDGELALTLTFDQVILNGLNFAVQYPLNDPQDVNGVMVPAIGSTKVIVKLLDMDKSPDKRFVKLHIRKWEGSQPAPSIVNVKIVPYGEVPQSGAVLSNSLKQERAL